MRHANPDVTPSATSSSWDVLVIGGGPAGLMAAGQAAQAGLQVALLEKMDRPGRKLRITGKGRCNLTNALPLEQFITHFGPNGRFLRAAFHQFFVHDLLAFFSALGIPTVTERGGRIFPVTNEASDITEELIAWTLRSGVKIINQCRAEMLVVHNQTIVGVRARVSGKEALQDFPCQAVVLSTGGASYPGTGSSGDGYRLARTVGHTIIPVRPALVPLETAGDVAAHLQGLSLKNVRVTVWSDGRKFADQFGEMLFTHFGISGPIILTLSKFIVDALAEGHKIELRVDLKPALDDLKLDQRLRRDFETHSKMQLKKILRGIMPQAMIPICLRETELNEEKPGNQITSQERLKLRLWLKNFKLGVAGHRPIVEAIITAGGVALNEIDRNSLESRLVKGLFFAGEVMDLDADTGGFNLQAAFSTGWLAGRSAARKITLHS